MNIHPRILNRLDYKLFILLSIGLYSTYKIVLTVKSRNNLVSYHTRGLVFAFTIHTSSFTRLNVLHRKTII